MSNDLIGLVTNIVPGVISELAAQGMSRPTFRSVWYVLRDRGLITGASSYINLNGVLSKARDSGTFPYELLSDNAGTSKRGMTAVELEDAIENARKTNVIPELVDGELRAILVEKAGLVPFFVDAVGGRVPIGSSGGCERKEWEHSWLSGLESLCESLRGNDIRIDYYGDDDDCGRKIAARQVTWIQTQFATIRVIVQAVTRAQSAVENRKRGLPATADLHLDGWIVYTGPRRAAAFVRRKLRASP